MSLVLPPQDLSHSDHEHAVFSHGSCPEVPLKQEVTWKTSGKEQAGNEKQDEKPNGLP